MDETSDIEYYREQVQRLHRDLTHAEELEIAKRILMGDDQAVEIFAEANLLFALECAEAYYINVARGTVTLPQLVRAANTGLFMAVRAYSSGEGKNFPFRDYAAWWIRQSMGEVGSTSDR